MRNLTGVLKDSRYPNLENLFLSICDRLDNTLCALQDEVESGEFSPQEICDKISKIRDTICAKGGEKHEEEADPTEIRIKNVTEFLDNMPFDNKNYVDGVLDGIEACGFRYYKLRLGTGFEVSDMLEEN